jgi:pilus assembly protein Flp/PilA
VDITDMLFVRGYPCGALVQSRANDCGTKLRGGGRFPLDPAKAAMRPTSAYFKESFMLRFIQSLSRDERGVSALEYAILAGIVVAALVAAGSVLSNGTTGLPGFFTTLMGKISGTIAGSGTSTP